MDSRKRLADHGAIRAFDSFLSQYPVEFMFLLAEYPFAPGKFVFSLGPELLLWYCDVCRKGDITSHEQNPKVRILFSSMSVFLTNSESLARDVSRIAQEHAASSTHVYALDSMQEIDSWRT